MAKYSWDIEELMKKRNFFKKQMEIYKELFETYESMIENSDKHLFTGNNDDYDDVENRSLKELQEDFFNTLSRKNISLITDSVDIISPFDTQIDVRNLSKLTISDEELVDTVRELFKKLPSKVFAKKFEDIAKHDNHLLHIRDRKKLPTNCLGLAYTDSLNHLAYGLVSRRNTIEDIISLFHESFHMIVREKEEPLFSTTNKMLYSETEGSFATLLICNMLKELGYNKDELDFVEKRQLIFALDTITSFYIITNGFNNIDEEGNIKLNQFNTFLKENNIYIPITQNTFCNLVSQISYEELSDGISYLTALDLFEQYKSNPEKILHTIQEIPMLKGDEPKKDLSSIGVTYFEDGYNNLEKECKKLLKRKTIS